MQKKSKSDLITCLITFQMFYRITWHIILYDSHSSHLKMDYWCCLQGVFSKCKDAVVSQTGHFLCISRVRTLGRDMENLAGFPFRTTCWSIWRASPTTASEKTRTSSFPSMTWGRGRPSGTQYSQMILNNVLVWFAGFLFFFSLCNSSDFIGLAGLTKACTNTCFLPLVSSF